MHVTLLANSRWLDEELPALKYLTVGLLDEQIHMAQVVPNTLPLEESSAFGERLDYEESTWQLIQRRRILALTEQLRGLQTTLIHVFDSGLWDVGLRLAAELDLPTLLNVWTSDDLDVASKLRSTINQQRVAFSCATQPFADAIADRFGSDARIDLVRPGIHLSRMEEKADHPDQPLCAFISGGGKLDGDYIALFSAIRDIAAASPESQFFLDAGGTEDPDLYKAIQHCDLQTNMSLVPHRLGHRELQLNADVIIHPQAEGRARSVTLQAMANGVPIIARDDPWLDYLIHEETAWLVDRDDADVWRHFLDQAINNPDAGKTLGMQAQQWVGKDHLASQQVSHLLKLYRDLTGESMKFSSGGR